MIQFNLLPAVKLEFVRARRNRRLALLVSTLVAGVSLLAMALLFANVQLQAKYSRDLSQDISSESKTLEGVEDISGILTVQNQLNSLSELHASKPEAERVATYLKQVTPTTVTISSVKTDFETQTMSISGSAGTAAQVNSFIDTLKFTAFMTTENPDETKAFTEVVLMSVAPDSQEASVKFDLTLKFDLTIFSNQTEVKLVVPNKVTTRSQLDRPSDVFTPQEENQ
jgi:Tfp pilus assembly protein PilN